MQKFLFIILLVFAALFLQSCTKTCFCRDDNNRTTELEIDPAEECSTRSSETLGICS
jgi:hypothetical protein